jgi:hypothetical protein
MQVEVMAGLVAAADALARRDQCRHRESPAPPTATRSVSTSGVHDWHADSAEMFGVADPRQAQDAR